MKKRLIILLLIFVSGSFVNCESLHGTVSSCKEVSWLQTRIDNFDPDTQHAEVIRYSYKGETVYYIDSCKGCADSMGVVYNCSGEVICKFGGIAGFNTCPDFENTATNRKVIYDK